LKEKQYAFHNQIEKKDIKYETRRATKQSRKLNVFYKKIYFKILEMPQLKGVNLNLLRSLIEKKYHNNISQFARTSGLNTRVIQRILI